MVDRKINISNLPEGHGIDKAILISLIEKAYDKMSQRMPGELLMEAHFKESHKQSKTGQVEVKLKAVVAGITLNTDSIEWGAEKALKGAIQAIEKEAEKAVQRKKRF